MAERLRRWTRNPMGFPRAGSNPAHSDKLTEQILSFCSILCWKDRQMFPDAFVIKQSDCQRLMIIVAVTLWPWWSIWAVVS